MFFKSARLARGAAWRVCAAALFAASGWTQAQAEICKAVRPHLSPAQADKFRGAMAPCQDGADARSPRAPLATPVGEPMRARQLALTELPPVSISLQRPVPATQAPRRGNAPALRPVPGARGVRDRAVQLAPVLDRAAAVHGIDPLLLHAIAHVESRYNPQAISHAGARGLMQVMPATGERFGVDAASSLQDVGANVQASASYLKVLQKRFGNDLPLVLAAYNAGEGAVERHGRQIPPYRETQGYVKQVMQRYAVLTRTRVAGGGALLQVAGR